MNNKFRNFQAIYFGFIVFLTSQRFFSRSMIKNRKTTKKVTKVIRRGKGNKWLPKLLEFIFISLIITAAKKAKDKLSDVPDISNFVLIRRKFSSPTLLVYVA